MTKFLGLPEKKKEPTELDRLLEKRKNLIIQSRNIKRKIIKVKEQIQKEKN
ncbi:MAG: hypothetical protein ACFFCV_05620 [Promethearchaeota archaeon]